MSTQLVETYQEALSSAKTFLKDIQTSGELQFHLVFFKSWYYFPGIDNVAPSKFVGYKGMTAGEYLAKYRTELTGSYTEARLKKWFRRVDSQVVAQKVLELTHKYGTRPRSGIRFNVPKNSEIPIVEDNTDEKSEAESSAVVEVFVRAISTLRPSERKELIDRLGKD